MKLLDLFVEFSLKGQAQVSAALQAVSTDMEKLQGAAARLGGELGTRFAAASELLQQSLAGKLRPAVESVTNRMVGQIAALNNWSAAQKDQLRQVLDLHGGMAKLQEALGQQAAGWGKATDALLKNIGAGRGLDASQTDSLRRIQGLHAALGNLQEGLRLPAAGLGALAEKLALGVAQGRDFTATQAGALGAVLRTDAGLRHLQESVGQNAVGLGRLGEALARTIAAGRGIGEAAGLGRLGAAAAPLGAGQVEGLQRILGLHAGLARLQAGFALPAAGLGNLADGLLRNVGAGQAFGQAQARAMQSVLGHHAALQALQVSLGQTPAGLARLVEGLTRSVQAGKMFSEGSAFWLRGLASFQAGLGTVQAHLRAFEEKMAGVSRAATLGFGILSGAVLGFVRQGLQGTAQGERLSLAFERLSMQIASVFLPVVEKITAWVERLVAWFRSLSGAQQDAILKWSLITAAGLGTLMVLPKLVAGFQAVTAALQAMAAAANVSRLAMLGVLGVAGLAVGGALALTGWMGGGGGPIVVADENKKKAEEIRKRAREGFQTFFGTNTFDEEFNRWQRKGYSFFEKLDPSLEGSVKRMKGGFFKSVEDALGDLADKPGRRDVLKAGGPPEALEATYFRIAQATARLGFEGKDIQEAMYDELKGIHEDTTAVKNQSPQPPSERK